MSPALLPLLTLGAALAKPAHGPATHSPPPDGAAVYAKYCALCHGADRAGYAADNAPSLRSPELWQTASPQWMWLAVAYGRPGTPMAAFSDAQGGPLDHDTQHALIDWLQAQAGVSPATRDEGPVQGDPARGAAVYAASCASCHGAQGEGLSAPALGNPVLLATSSDSFLREAVRRGRSGTPMRGYADTLSAQQIDDVVSFLRSRAGGWTAPAPVVVRPPAPSAAVIHPGAPPAQFSPREGRFVPAAAVAAALSAGARMVLLDARPLSDWQRGHLPGALPVPFYDGVDAILPHIPKDGTPVVAYCACPHAASGQVVDALRAAGVKSAFILDEGVLFWAAQGYPIAVGGAQP
jgi:mono/diheme cytochrome c family protein/rhodanese-related sulfurtransferase